MNSLAKLVGILLFVLQLLLFTFIAQHRFVDADEGFYLLASRLVLQHKKPYVDFFFQQAPLLPYVYALWLKCFHMTWQWARLLPVLLTSLLGILIYSDVYHQTRRCIVGTAAVVLFATSTLVFAWMPIAKPYSLGGLFIFAAYVAVTRSAAKQSRWLLAGSGLLLGLATDTRSYLVLTTPLFLWWISRNSSARLKSMMVFLVGFGIGLLPSFYLFVTSPAAFVFDNLGYHAIRTDAGLIGMWGQKLGIVLMLLLGGPEGNGIQNCLLFVISLAFVFSVNKAGWAPRLAFQLAVLLGVISLLPTPVLPQYFSFCVPFLVVSTACATEEAVSSLKEIRIRAAALGACVLLAAIYVAASLNDLRKYLVTGDGIPTVRWAVRKDDWKIQSVLQVSRAIDQIARPGEMVASFWPGYVFQTQATPFPGLENDCGVLIADKLSSKQRSHFHIASWAELNDNFSAHVPRIVVTGNHYNHESPLVPHVMGEEVEASLVAHGYKEIRELGDTAIYSCCSNLQKTSHDANRPRDTHE